MKLHHVQVACARGTEDTARRFYAEGLGLTEVEKPDDLKPKGGVWFRAYDGEGVVTAEIHVGVEDPFAPALKAHPALQFTSVSELEEVPDPFVPSTRGEDGDERGARPRDWVTSLRDPAAGPASSRPRRRAWLPARRS